MSTIKEGDRVRIVTREQTEEDAKANLYFTYYGGLTGTVLKVYNKQEVSVEVEQDSLTREVRKRHEDVRDQMKTKWLDGLSEEGRNRLTEREKDFNLRYVVLVAMTDLEKAGAKPAAQTVAAKPIPVAAASTTTEETPVPPRRTLAEIEAAEAEELRRRAGG
jgi:hypothetical protein